MITSKDNARVKQIRALQATSKARQESGLFVVEGVRLVEEAFSSGWEAEWVLYTTDLGARGLELVNRFQTSQAQVDLVTEEVMRSISDTMTPQGLLAVFRHKEPNRIIHLDFAFIPDSVRDPGNLGSMLRTAAAAGVQTFFIPPGNVDPYSPKVLRSGMGAHFHMRIEQLSWSEIAHRIEEAGMQVFLADVGKGVNYTQANFRPPMALILGGEAQGAGEQAKALATQWVHIPMPGQCESLNAGTATAILLFEVVRQRGLSEVAE